MHVETKRLTFLGALAAISVILVILSGYIEMNTLFLLAAASFCLGIGIRETNLTLGTGYFAATVLLSFLLAPNKIYCFTFLLLSAYIWIHEGAFYLIGRMKKKEHPKMLLWLIKYAGFNLMVVPILLFFPQILVQGEATPKIMAALWLLAQICVYFFDMIYEYFQTHIWNKVRYRIFHDAQ